MKKKNKSLRMFFIGLFLGILVTISFVILANVFDRYKVNTDYQVINLINKNETNKEEINKEETDNSEIVEQEEDLNSDSWVKDEFNSDLTLYTPDEWVEDVIIPGETINHDFDVYDYKDETQRFWETETEIDIFKTEYDLTVISDNGEKVIAPGTKNTYDFYVRNNGDVSINYKLSTSAYFTPSNIEIPVNVTFVKDDDTYLLGSDVEDVGVLNLEGYSEENSLASGAVTKYSINWIWEFEEDDVYDTNLGNLAVDDDISLTIKINTYAESDLESYEGTVIPGYYKPGKRPYTGDSSHIEIYVTAFVLGLVGLIIMIVPFKKRDEEDEDD